LQLLPTLADGKSWEFGKFEQDIFTKNIEELWNFDLELDSIDEFINNHVERLNSFLTHL